MSMDFVYNLLVAAHILGLAALIGGWIATRSGSTTLAPLVWGARAQLVTGLLLVGLAEGAMDAEVNHVKIGVKLLIAIAVAAAAEIGAARAKRDEPNPVLVNAAGGLAILNVLVAVLWR